MVRNMDAERERAIGALCLALDPELEKILPKGDDAVFDRCMEILNGLIDDNKPLIGMVKMHAVYDALGIRILKELERLDIAPWLDMKLHDVPKTVGERVRALSHRLQGKGFITVHLGGGEAMCAAAVGAASKFPEIKIIGITVLTSLEQADLPKVGVQGTLVDQVSRLVDIGRRAGVHGYVCSGEEAALLRSTLGRQADLITPGVRMADEDPGGQRRVVTPGEAISSGASRVVAGTALVNGGAARARLYLQEIMTGLVNR